MVQEKTKKRERETERNRDRVTEAKRQRLRAVGRQRASELAVPLISFGPLPHQED